MILREIKTKRIIAVNHYTLYRLTVSKIMYLQTKVHFHVIYLSKHNHNIIHLQDADQTVK